MTAPCKVAAAIAAAASNEACSGRNLVHAAAMTSAEKDSAAPREAIEVAVPTRPETRPRAGSRSAC